MTETQLRKEPLPDFESEEEVDFARYGRALAARWWLVATGVAAGVVIGLLLSLGGTTVYEAQAVTYLGQPLAPGAGGQVSSVPTQLALASETARAESTIQSVAAKVGLKPRQLRGHITARPVQGLSNARTGTPAPIIAISVTGRQPKKVAAAANALADIVGARGSAYVNEKIRQLESRLAYVAVQIVTVKARLARAQKQLQIALDSDSLDPAARLISIQNYSSIVNSSETRLSGLETDRFGVRQTLALARNIEQGKLLTRASAVGSSARSRRNSVLVGALIGLILGALAAILWEPVTGRFASRPAA
jgi:capsular polysaccharide biosynthesis protein